MSVIISIMVRDIESFLDLVVFIEAWAYAMVFCFLVIGWVRKTLFILWLSAVTAASLWMKLNPLIGLVILPLFLFSLYCAIRIAPLEA